jgi:hypothetical protein
MTETAKMDDRITTQDSGTIISCSSDDFDPDSYRLTSGWWIVPGVIIGAAIWISIILWVWSSLW